MKLSEAIRLGSMMKPQTFGSLYNSSGTCAIGAAYDAIGILDKIFLKEYQYFYETRMKEFPLFDKIGVTACPICKRPNKELHTIAHLNDFHEWTREEIADWIEIIEKEHEINDVTAIPQPQPITVTV